MRGGEWICRNYLSQHVVSYYSMLIHIRFSRVTMVAQYDCSTWSIWLQGGCSRGLLRGAAAAQKDPRVECSAFTIRLRGAQIPHARVSMGLIWWASRMVWRAMLAWLGSHVPHVAGAHIHASSAELVWDVMACGAYGASAVRGRARAARGVAG